MAAAVRAGAFIVGSPSVRRSSGTAPTSPGRSTKPARARMIGDQRRNARSAFNPIWPSAQRWRALLQRLGGGVGRIATTRVLRGCLVPRSFRPIELRPGRGALGLRLLQRLGRRPPARPAQRRPPRSAFSTARACSRSRFASAAACLRAWAESVPSAWLRPAHARPRLRRATRRRPPAQAPAHPRPHRARTRLRPPPLPHPTGPGRAARRARARRRSRPAACSRRPVPRPSAGPARRGPRRPTRRPWPTTPAPRPRRRAGPRGVRTARPLAPPGPPRRRP